MKFGQYIFKKEIDWSALHRGINISVLLQDIFLKNLNINLQRGESKKIKFLIGNTEYPAIISNILFDIKKYPNHKDLLQIRYSPNSETAKVLRTIFQNSYDYLRIEREKLENKRIPLSVPKLQREYLAIYSTFIDDVFYIECFTYNEIVQIREEFEKYDEFEIETIMNTTDNPSIAQKNSVVKIRKLDNSIGNGLKVAYEYKCQICGMFIGELYNATVINVHHIEYFSKSLNNNAENLLVVCPNHHGIIHNTNPIFDRNKKVYIYPNGYKEGLKLNLHL